MTSDPAAIPSAPARHTLLTSRLAWPLAALVYTALMVACVLWGLRTGERGIDTRAQELLGAYAAGAPLGLIALAPFYGWLVPRRSWIGGVIVALFLVAGATAAAISFVGFAVNSPWWDAFQPDLSLKLRVWILGESYGLNVFLFLTLGYRVAMPQGLVPLVLAALWLADRRRRI
jgi:hypothetical protein